MIARTPLAFALFLGVIFSLMLLAGCNPIKSNTAAEKGVAAFHKLLDAADFKGIYDAAHPDFKKATNEKELTEFLEAIHRKLGNVQSTDREGWNINSYNFQTNVDMTYKTKFAEGEGTETFRYRIDGDKATLIYYNINSRALITK